MRGEVKRLSIPHSIEMHHRALQSLSIDSESYSDSGREDNEREGLVPEDNTPRDDESVASNLSDEGSMFTSEVAETMVLLREACQDIENPTLAMRSFESLRIMCKGRFNAKERLAASGAAEHIAMLFIHWKDDPVLILIACSAMSQFISGETENKMALGMLQICENLMIALETQRNDLLVVKACCQLTTDLCNCILKGLLRKYVKGRKAPLGVPLQSPSFLPPPPLPESADDDFLFSDNRERFGQAGACELLTSILIALTSAEDAVDEDMVAVTVIVCQTIATLAANPENSRLFGAAGIARPIVGMLMDRFPTNRSIAALWVIVILCADKATGNKERFGKQHAPKVIVDFLYDLERCEKDYANEPLDKLIEQLGWALLNVCVGCEENESMLGKGVSYAKTAVRTVLDMDTVKEECKSKLRSVDKMLFCKHK